MMNTGKHRGFQARSVVRGVFIKFFTIPRYGRRVAEIGDKIDATTSIFENGRGRNTRSVRARFGRA
jgi:hypothetical protein